MRIALPYPVSLLILLSFADTCFSQAGQTAPAGETKAAEPRAKKPRLAVTISEETTRIVRPLREDGYVDYVAALNEHQSRGVTPENNAAVLFWRAMGPAEIAEGVRQRYFELLRTARLPDEGDYFVSFGEYLEGRGMEWDTEVDDQFDPAAERPWSNKEFPIVADWLKKNEKPLTLVIEATRRPRFYSPLVATEDASLPMISVLFPPFTEYREVARALIRRAMLRLHEGKVDEAFGDLLACHRLARLVGEGPTLIDALVSIALDGVACTGDAALAHSGKLTAEKAAKFQAELRRLGPMPKMADKLDRSERFMFLDAVAAIARGGPEAIRQLEGAGGPRKPTVRGTLMKWAVNAAVDWDEVLRTGNSFYDELVEGCRKPAFSQRAEALNKMDDKIQEVCAEVRDLKSVGRDLLVGKTPRKVLTERMSGILTGLLMPAMVAATKAEDRATTQLHLTCVVLALAGYRADHGAYPAKLSELTPEYIDELPKDLFSEKDFRYRRKGKGYLLYSVGPNGQDDEGRNARRDPEAEDSPDYQGDDIAIRAPSKKT